MIVAKRRPHRAFAVFGAVVLIMAFAPALVLAESFDVRVEQGWARPAIAHGNGAAYFVITNAGDEPVALIGAEGMVARFIEIHETYVIDPAHAHDEDEHGHDHHDHGHHEHHHDHGHDHGAGTMLGMRKVDRIEIAPGAAVAFEPGGYHVMLIDLVEALAWGQEFELVLHFEGGHAVTATIQVGSEPSR